MQILTTYGCSHADDTAEAAEPEPKLTHQSSFNSRPDHSLAAPASNLVPCDSERQRHLQQALILQMDMQKKLHDQLAVCFHSTIIQADICPPHVLQHVSAGSWQVPIMIPHKVYLCRPACMYVLHLASLRRLDWQFSEQAQRQLQISLEAHSRYIHSLMEADGPSRQVEQRQLEEKVNFASHQELQTDAPAMGSAMLKQMPKGPPFPLPPSSPTYNRQIVSMTCMDCVKIKHPLTCKMPL